MIFLNLSECLERDVFQGKGDGEGDSKVENVKHRKTKTNEYITELISKCQGRRILRVMKKFQEGGTGPRGTLANRSVATHQVHWWHTHISFIHSQHTGW